MRSIREKYENAGIAHKLWNFNGTFEKVSKVIKKREDPGNNKP